MLNALKSLVMNLKFVCLLLIILPWQSKLGAQNLEKLERKADKEFYDEDLEGSLATYNEILAIKSDHKLAEYRAEICSLLTKYRGNPIEKLVGYSSTQGRKDKFFHYWLGKAHFRQNHFTKAIESWQKFLHLKKFKSKIITAETKALIERAELAHEQFSHPDNFEVEHLHNNVNSVYSEYSPVYFKDKEELLFLSSRPGGSGKKGKYHVYHSYRSGDSWAKPTPIDHFGQFEERNANIEVVNNDGRLFVYKEKKGGELYYSELKNDRWGELVEFDGKITASKLESHFFINEKEDRVLFAARKRAKPADFDIFESFKDASTGKWSKPEPLSSLINSEFDEDYPFLSMDEKTLYFCSKGFESLGGYDVYKSVWDEAAGQWGKPESLQYPVNTPDDDIQFKLSEDQTSGYFVSNRFGSKGEFDIYVFHASNKVQIEGVVYNVNGDPVNLAEIHFVPSRKTGLLVKTMTDEQGRYKAKVSGDDEIAISISIDHELVFSENLTTPKVGTFPVSITKDFRLETDKEVVKHADYHLDDPVFTDIEKIGNKFRHSNRALLHNIYFDFAKYEVSEEGVQVLDELVESLLKNIGVRIEIAGHTDNTGAADVNMTVSLKRAEAVKNHLIARGVTADRVIAKGYGETRPIASNDDETDGRELNRRIEITVLE